MRRLYANENFPFAVVTYLRRMGYDVLTTAEAHQANRAISDPDVLAFAVGDVRAVITLNRRDFIKLHTMTPDHEGIIVCKVDTDFLAQAHAIHEGLTALPSLKNQLVRIARRDRRDVIDTAKSRLQLKTDVPK